MQENRFLKDRCKTVKHGRFTERRLVRTMAGNVLARMPSGGLPAYMCTDNSLLRELFVRIIVKYGERVASFLLQGNRDFVKYQAVLFWCSFCLLCWFDWFLTEFVQWSFICFNTSPHGGVEFWPITTETNFVYGGKISQKMALTWSLKNDRFLSNIFFLHQYLTVLKRPIVKSEKCHENISSWEQSNSNDDPIKVWLGKIYELFTLHFIYACFSPLERLEKRACLVSLC